MAGSLVRGASAAVVGAGAAGSSLARALSGVGLQVECVVSRSLESARWLAGATGAKVASDDPSDLREVPDLLILAVPDDEIAVIAEAIAARDLDWTGCTVLHLSGVVPSSALSPLRRRRAETGSFHPMVSLHRDSPPGVFSGAWINVEGTEAAVGFARTLGEVLGARVAVVDAHAKSMIHLAASLASNYFVTLMKMAADVLAAADVDAGSNEAILRPLVAGTLRNVDFRDPAQALTGPISRGDLDTLRGHLDLIREHIPAYLTSFAVLAAETVRIARKTQKITAEEAAQLLDLLEEFMDAEASDNSG